MNVYLQGIYVQREWMRTMYDACERWMWKMNE